MSSSVLLKSNNNNFSSFLKNGVRLNLAKRLGQLNLLRKDCGTGDLTPSAQSWTASGDAKRRYLLGVVTGSSSSGFARWRLQRVQKRDSLLVDVTLLISTTSDIFQETSCVFRHFIRGKRINPLNTFHDFPETIIWMGILVESNQLFKKMKENSWSKNE